MNKKIKIIVFIVLAVIAAGVGVSYGTFEHYQGETVFLEGTSLGGNDVSGSTPAQVADALADYYDTDKIKVRVLEDGEDSITGTLADFGYSCDRATFEEFLNQAFYDEKKDMASLVNTLRDGYEIHAKEAYVFDEKKFNDAVKCSALAVPRVETVDPAIVFDEEKQYYYTVPGSEGNMIDEDKLRASVKDTLEYQVNAGGLAGEIVCEITQDLYTSVPPKDNMKELQEECDAKNLEIRKKEKLAQYKKSKVTYVFGGETQVLDTKTIQSWISVDDMLAVKLDQSKIEAYVTSLKAKYDTQYLKRTFTTTGGGTIKFSGKQNEYGYRIDYEKECSQLRKDILSRKPVEREPIYVTQNNYGNPLFLKRNGRDDLCGTYVEVNLTKQHLWFYKDGALIIESDIVSGDVSDKKETHTGVLPLAFKESPRVLTGDEASGSGSYSTRVQYWMPFYDGQGLHDAGWRHSFGGQIYRSSGSHGCVNLPPSVAQTIYNNIEVGTAIILYKEK